MNISITPTESAGVSRRLQITVPADTVASYEDQAARKYATQVRLPGFRPGKAPPSMVRKKFPEAVRQEAIELVINEAFREAIEREGLKLAAQPHVDRVRYPGLDTHARALAAGDPEAGCTVHIVTETLDDGPTLAQARVPVLAGDTAETLAARVLEAEHRLYPQALADFLATLP